MVKIIRVKSFSQVLHGDKVSNMHLMRGHITGSIERAAMSEAFAMQCMSAVAGLLAQNPMSRRNDAYTAIYYFRY